MKIGIEGQRLFRPNKHGMDMVALEIIRNLQMIDQENEYVIFVKPDTDNTVIRETPNFRIVKLDGGPYPLWEQYTLPRAARKEGCDILHCTSNTAPLQNGMNLVVTLHDIIYMEKSYLKILAGSGTGYQRFGNAYRHAVVPRILPHTRKIITVSNYEKERISEFFGLKDDNRLTVVYNGVGEHFRPVCDEKELQRVKGKYHLPDRFFFYFGNPDPKKNTRGTIKAFGDFALQQQDVFLVMPDYDPAALDRILAEIGRPEIKERILLTGYIMNTDLPAIYSLCELFLYPSLRESFGIPILEAMASGAPVIASTTSSMPEIAGNAALLVNPYRTEEITAAMHAISRSDLLKDSLVIKGIDQAAKFSWKTAALQVRKIYEEIGHTQKNNTGRTV